ncbi:NF041680 family putative transposase [Actinoplanes palleronii]|uniref:NF041680 family putative transposase n=1 Tax=Actinoplanes palleronii TaxID=113570 RepID=UPI001945649A|nr:NF041680 family putative transposase [Actinoplanes palleronii]
MISVHDAAPVGAVGRLAGFRREFHRCLTARADALFELADALLCGDTSMRSLVELSLAGEHRRGHGSLYAALNRGRIDVELLRTALAAIPVPRAADGRIVLAVDVTCWLRPEAHTSPQRVLCHTYGRGKDTHIMIPGWPYSLVTALETGRSSWTARRLAPGDDAATVTARQLRDVVERLIAAGQWQNGDPDIWIVADAGYDGPRLAFLLTDLPLKVLVRMRSDRVLRRPAPPRLPTSTGRPPRHGGEFAFGDPASWGNPDTATTTDTRLYGTATARAWHRLHPRLTHRTAWTSEHGPLPIIEGTVILLTVDRLPSGAAAKPVWLWWSHPEATDSETDLAWQTFLRRFDIEHTFRMLKQTLGWTSPKLRDPAAADRWTWLVLAAYTQLRLARGAVADLRRPWERPTPAERLSPARVRRGFRHIHRKTGSPTTAPKPSRPGPGRPPGQRNQHPAIRHDVHIVTSTKPTTNTKNPGQPNNPRPRRTG